MDILELVESLAFSGIRYSGRSLMMMMMMMMIVVNVVVVVVKVIITSFMHKTCNNYLLKGDIPSIFFESGAYG